MRTGNLSRLPPRAAQIGRGGGRRRNRGAAAPCCQLRPTRERWHARPLIGERRILLKGGVVYARPPIGDFAHADVLIETARSARSADIAIAGDAAAVIDANSTASCCPASSTPTTTIRPAAQHPTNGLLNPDYGRDIGNTLTPAYAPADAYAGVLVTALGMIDMGTTTAVDTSQVSHTPEHSDACIRALQESGIRAVYAYWRGSGPDSKYPQDIVRLQRSHFSSKDQLLTLAMGSSLDAKIFAYAREVGVPTVSHGVNNNTEPRLLELARAGLLRPGDEYIHCTHLSDAAWRPPGTPARRSPSPRRSRWRWATACRPFRTPSTTASGRR